MSAGPHCGGTVESIDSICRYCGSYLNLLPSGDNVFGVMRLEIVVEGPIAFHERELVQVESVEPDSDRPESKYVVRSRSLDRQFRLSDRDLMT